jgi:hypothetical protein
MKSYRKEESQDNHLEETKKVVRIKKVRPQMKTTKRVTMKGSKRNQRSRVSCEDARKQRRNLFGELS